MSIKDAFNGLIEWCLQFCTMPTISFTSVAVIMLSNKVT